MSLVLVADDDDDIRAIVTTAIESLGHEVLGAADGREAQAFLESRMDEIDLAVLDMGMPGKTGLELCAFIKGNAKSSLIPVLMLTARDDIEDKVQAFEGGVDDYVTKPFHFNELQARIKAWLRVRELNVNLCRSNHELELAQEKLIESERQLVLVQLVGTIAHSLGQPLSAILLNCHLLERLDPQDARAARALQAIKTDAQRMAEMVDQFKALDARRTEEYYKGNAILALEEEKEDPCPKEPS